MRALVYNDFTFWIFSLPTAWEMPRQLQQGWGAKVIERLAKDLKEAFPEMKGFSRTNLLHMRSFAEAYPNEEIVQQLVGLL
jgi:DUF1016 N-terminal domain